MIIAIVTGNLALLAGFMFLDFDIAGVESNVVFTVQKIINDNALLYANPEELPFTITQYSPLYYIIYDGISTFLGVAPDDGFHLRVFGRSLSLFLSGAVIFTFYSIVRKQVGLGKSWALIACLGVWSFPVPWHYLTRPDVFLTFFYLLYLRVALRYVKRPGSSLAFYMGVIIGLALISKQSAIFLIGFTGVYFVYQRRFSHLFMAMAGFASLLLIFAGVFKMLGYEATYMYSNLVKGVDNGFGVRSFVDHTLLAFFSTYGSYLAITALIYFKIIKKIEGVTAELKFLIIFSLLLFLFSTLTATKLGSAVNYYHDFLIATWLVWMYFMKQYNVSFSSIWLKRIRLALSITIVLVVITHLRIFSFSNIKKMLTPDVELARLNNFMSQEVGESYLYSNVRQVSLRFPSNVILPQFDIAECCAYPRRVYNYDQLCEVMHSGELKFLVLDTPISSTLLGCEVAEYYLLNQEFGMYRVYKHKTY